MTSIASRLHSLANASLALLCATLLAACGSGGVSAPPTVNTADISVTPSTATVFAGLPSNFVITGGNGTYNVISNNQAIIPSIAALAGNSFTVLPQDVAADTAVTLTVQDLATSKSASAAVTVKSRTISNVVTITPSAGQATACGTSICAGGDAQVTVKLAQAGVPLVNRSVRFDVVSGAINFITSSSGSFETLAASTTVTTDSSGAATVRVRATSDVATQTALIDVTDLASGARVRAGVAIASLSTTLTAQPTALVFQGATSGACASGTAADVIITGGRPPYTITQVPSFSITPLQVTSSGGHFTVTTTGTCAPTTPIAIADANGTTTTITATNSANTATVTAVGVAPKSVVLTSCNDVANIAITGGLGNYFATQSNAVLTASVSGNVGLIRTTGRTQGGGNVGGGPFLVAFSDGRTSDTVSVTLSGSAPQCTGP